jgi:crotonobetainyl-CoA:carnitine CoA-transferase CaiB-like acyl-CoA transferase
MKPSGQRGGSHWTGRIISVRNKLEDDGMAGPLEGYRIIDCTQMISGPLATMILGDQGADVIKVEPPGRGDLTRVLGGTSGISPTFATSNRNKRSIAINLKPASGIGLLKRLTATADLFIQNFRPGTAERMGIGEPAMRAVKPDLIYISISGFGEKGPYVHKRVYDPVVQALSGLASIQADASGRPRMMRLIIPDKVSALTAAQAMTAALLARERTGKGQHVRLAMLDAVVSFLWPEGMAGHTFLRRKDVPVRQASRDLIYETRDGYITAGAISDSEWLGMARALEHPEWVEDPRFNTPGGRVRNVDERLEMTAEVLKTRTSAEWLKRLDAEQVPCGQVNRREDLLSDPQVRANGLIVETEHPHAGPMRQARPAARFEATPAEIRRPAPMVGEHTNEILTEIGVGASEMKSLRGDGVIA